MVSLKKYSTVPFYRWGSTVLKSSQYEETNNFLPLSPHEVLVLIWSISEGWKAELALEPHNGFEPGTHWLEIQRPNH